MTGPRTRRRCTAGRGASLASGGSGAGLHAVGSSKHAPETAITSAAATGTAAALLIRAAPGTASAQVSLRPIARADGSLDRTWTPVALDDGVAWTPPDALGGQTTRVRVGPAYDAAVGFTDAAVVPWCAECSDRDTANPDRVAAEVAGYFGYAAERVNAEVILDAAVAAWPGGEEAATPVTVTVVGATAPDGRLFRTVILGSGTGRESGPPALLSDRSGFGTPVVFDIPVDAASRGWAVLAPGAVRIEWSVGRARGAAALGKNGFAVIDRPEGAPDGMRPVVTADDSDGRVAGVFDAVTAAADDDPLDLNP